jgi:hypothetical protein
MTTTMDRVLSTCAVFIVYFILGSIVASYGKVASILFSDEINTLTTIVNGLFNV